MIFKRFLLFISFLLISNISLAQVSFFSWRWQREDGSCKDITNGRKTDMCHDSSTNFLYTCVPDEGENGICDTESEWKLITTDINNTLSELEDTNINSPTNGQFLKYNATTQKWENEDFCDVSDNYCFYYNESDSELELYLSGVLVTEWGIEGTTPTFYYISTEDDYILITEDGYYLIYE